MNKDQITSVLEIELIHQLTLNQLEPHEIHPDELVQSYKEASQRVKHTSYLEFLAGNLDMQYQINEFSADDRHRAWHSMERLKQYRSN